VNELAVSSPGNTSGTADARLYGLSLCAGAGGVDIGLTIACPGYRTVCYVEREAYAAATLVARMEDKALDCAPVWDDVGTFNSRPWRGAVDIITGGYPCTPFSVAGKRQRVDDPRHLWPHFAQIISECRPEWVFLENVANHLNLGYREVRSELEELDFRATEGLFTAAEVGAPHKRQRLFVLAHAKCGGGGNPPENLIRKGNHFVRPSGKKAHLGLDQAAKMWPTPMASDGCKPSAGTLASGDRIDIDGTSYTVQGEPVRDRERLIWTADLVPA
jgi:DNA (cytosine-5)-methyltransferase 1